MAVRGRGLAPPLPGLLTDTDPEYEEEEEWARDDLRLVWDLFEPRAAAAGV